MGLHECIRLQGELERAQAALGRLEAVRDANAAGGPLDGMLEERIEEKRNEVAALAQRLREYDADDARVVP